ncbi:MAG: mechanosensitive ion channel domain-containing protein [Candidatus Dormiibacterota bacterium]
MQQNKSSPLTWRIVRAVAALVVVLFLFAGHDFFIGLVPAKYTIPIEIGIAIVVAVIGTIAIREWLSLIFRSVDRQAAVVLRNFGTWALYAILALSIAAELGVNLSGLLVGGAILGVVVATAAQTSLGNFFAGLVLMLARPFEIGATVRLRSSIAGTIEFEGTVADTNALYTTLRTARGELLRLPNGLVVNSALVVGRPPVQGSLQVEVPTTTTLATLRRGIHERLGDRAAQVTVVPTQLRAAAGEMASTLLCQVEVRSRRPLDESTFAAAIVGALALHGVVDASAAPPPP